MTSFFSSYWSVGGGSGLHSALRTSPKLTYAYLDWLRTKKHDIISRPAVADRHLSNTFSVRIIFRSVARAVTRLTVEMASLPLPASVRAIVM